MSFHCASAAAERRVEVDVNYKGKVTKVARIDTLVEIPVVSKRKTVSKLLDVAGAQTLRYRKATGLRRVLLFNFGETKLVDGIKRHSL